MKKFLTIIILGSYVSLLQLTTIKLDNNVTINNEDFTLLKKFSNFFKIYLDEWRSISEIDFTKATRPYDEMSTIYNVNEGQFLKEIIKNLKNIQTTKLPLDTSSINNIANVLDQYVMLKNNIKEYNWESIYNLLKLTHYLEIPVLEEIWFTKIVDILFSLQKIPKSHAVQYKEEEDSMHPTKEPLHRLINFLDSVQSPTLKEKVIKKFLQNKIPLQFSSKQKLQNPPILDCAFGEKNYFFTINQQGLLTHYADFFEEMERSGSRPLVEPNTNSRIARARFSNNADYLIYYEIEDPKVSTTITTHLKVYNCQTGKRIYKKTYTMIPPQGLMLNIPTIPIETPSFSFNTNNTAASLFSNGTIITINPDGTSAEYQIQQQVVTAYKPFFKTIAWRNNNNIIISKTTNQFGDYILLNFNTNTEQITELTLEDKPLTLKNTPKNLSGINFLSSTSDDPFMLLFNSSGHLYTATIIEQFKYRINEKTDKKSIREITEEPTSYGEFSKNNNFLLATGYKTIKLFESKPDKQNSIAILSNEYPEIPLAHFSPNSLSVAAISYKENMPNILKIENLHFLGKTSNPCSLTLYSLQNKDTLLAHYLTTAPKQIQAQKQQEPPLQKPSIESSSWGSWIRQHFKKLLSVLGVAGVAALIYKLSKRGAQHTPSPAPQ